MKESYREYLASNSGLEPYAGDGDIAGVASARGNAGQPLSSEITTSVCRSCPVKEKAPSSLPFWQGIDGHGGVGDPVHAWTFQAREPGDPVGFRCTRWQVHRTAERSENASGGTADMHANRKSDGPIVLAKRANKTGTPAAESVEERGPPNGNGAQYLLVPDTVPVLTGHPKYCVSTARRDGNILTVNTKGRSRMR